MSTETVTIHAIGAEGDGIARTPQGPVFVPFTLPGEEVAIARVKSQGTAMSWATTSADRVAPKCRHFGPEGKGGACGGCSLQHWADQPYHDYKRGLVIDALRSHDIETEVAPLVTCSAGERRRVTMSGRLTDKGVVLGFMQALSHTIVPVEECPIAQPAIVAQLAAVRRLASALAAGSEPFRVTIQVTTSGLDVNFADLKKPDAKKRQAATDLAMREPHIARVGLENEILIETRKPMIEFDGVPVVLPPGSFLQATASAESAMAELVIAHVGKAKRVVDMFAGCGTFSLRLARKSAVHAVEFDAPALAALDHAARHAQGLKPVSIERRDLFRRPMLPLDLKHFDAVVFDPPRAGAEAQCHELARSKVARIAAVSCNPVTLVRDLSILIAGGYKLKSVTPIDQFLWSSHVEAVALLER
ncbi:class I SAM-dependent RNA methyltransferase [Rhizobium sp. KVB221]|uniref:Class I SAM-dependent RNA methyltransferase n=1 Tax=Rhizobium setariae TaxID=2801340 RepID=A0A937CMD3_9HYPH|nr:class I SAM-dependent RNA methyltransferase [Rhizobium setariae]MBL0370794.1 class I SAM-dependent RNA methyltransferase [Rhizobium setariae]